MSLIKLWKQSPEQFTNKHVQQIIGFAGSGKLQDGSSTFKEFRDFLSLLPSTFLSQYADNLNFPTQYFYKISFKVVYYPVD
jgi:hypothetical protein